MFNYRLFLMTFCLIFVGCAGRVADSDAASDIQRKSVRKYERVYERANL